MEKLSFELIDHIVSYLPAGDVLALSAVCQHVRPPCLSRLDPERYFARAFANPRLLLAAMTDLGCILSGSRALGYFVPGSIDTAAPDELASDWDFLVPCVPSSVLGMMDALERCGVCWENPLEPIFALLHRSAPVGAVEHIRTASLHRVTAEDLVRSSREPIAAPALELYKCLRRAAMGHTLELKDSCFQVEVAAAAEQGGAPAAENVFRSGGGRSLVITELSVFDTLGTRRPQARNDPLQQQTIMDDSQYSGKGRPLHVVNGTIAPPGSRGGRCKVQLFQCHAKERRASTPLSYVFDTYYASHVQCFLSGWAAGHFYYDLVRHRLALTWPPKANRGQNAARMPLFKYRKRGYQFISTGSMANIASEVESFQVHRPFPSRRIKRERTRAVFDTELLALEDELHIRIPSAAKEALFAYISSGEPLLLGSAGTLLIRFRTLEDTMVRLSRHADADTPTSSASESGASEGEAYTVARHYSLLGEMLRDTGRWMTTDQPSLYMPNMPELRRTKGKEASAPQLRRVLAMAMPNHGNNAAGNTADGALAAAAAASLDLDADNPRSRYHRLILRLSPRGCTEEDCGLVLFGKEPPQI